MRTSVYRLLEGGLLALSLVACSQEIKVEQTAPSHQTASSSTSSSSQQTKDKEDPRGESVYDPIVSQYRASLGKEVSQLDVNQVSAQLVHALDSEAGYQGLYTSQFDVNGDGLEELFVALKKGADYVVIDLYTLLMDGSVIRLNQTEAEWSAQHPVTLYQRGIYSQEVNGHLAYYLYDDHLPGLKALTEVEEGQLTVQPLTSLTWQAVTP